mgnify:CR=1 FL=1
MDRKELETQVLNMVAMSYKQDIKIFPYPHPI